MADPFRLSPPPSSPRPPSLVTPWVMASAPSTLAQRGHSTVPSTPTPNQPYLETTPPRDSEVFKKLEAILQEARTVVSFEWKPSKCQGKFVPVP